MKSEELPSGWQSSLNSHPSTLNPIDRKLNDRKLNVAITRARQQLFVIGIPHVLSTDDNYRALIEEMGESGND